MSMLLVGLYEVSRQLRTLLALFGQVIKKYFRMNTSIDLEPLTEKAQHLGWAKCLHNKKIDI